MKIDLLAKHLYEAQLSKSTIEPIRNIIGATDIEKAYEIQNKITELRVDDGARIVGRKIGLTSDAVQKQLGVDQPDFGTLFHDMEALNGDKISLQNIVQGRVEGEIAFVLSEDLDCGELTIVDLIACIDYCLPAIEIVGSRIKDWDLRITDTVADNASASHFVLGHTPKTLDEFDIVRTQMNLSINDKSVVTGTGANCMGSPLNALLWLAKTMQAYETPLLAGDLILSGALGAFVPMTAGDKVVADFTGLGQVSIEFTA